MRFFLFLTILIFKNVTLVAQEQTFIREFTYKAGEMDSKYSCRIIATNQLRSILLNEIGVYVESESILKTTDVDGKFAQNFTENISTISAGITKLKILEEKWNGEIFWMKASITVDPTELEKSLRQLSNDRQKIKELEYVKDQLNQATKSIDQLKKDLTVAKSEIQRIAISEQYLFEVDELENTFSSLFNGVFLSKSEGLNDKIKENPNDGFLYWQRGSTKQIMKDFQEAIIDYNKAIELGYTNAYQFRAEAKYELKDYKGALEDYNKAIEKDNEHHNDLVYQYYQGRGLTKIELQDYEGALNDYDRAIELSDFDWAKAKIYWKRGNLKYQLKDYEGAVFDFKKSKELQPLDATFYKTRGDGKQFAKNYEGAVADYNHAIDMDSNNPEYYFNRAIAKSNLGIYSEAIFDYDRTISLSPKFESVYLYRGTLICKLLSNRASLYRKLFNLDIYTGSYESFIKEFVTNSANSSKLYSFLNKNGWDLSYQEFIKVFNFEYIDEYFYDKKTKEAYDFMLSRNATFSSLSEFEKQMNDPKKIQVFYAFIMKAVCDDISTAIELGEQGAAEEKEVYCK